jgi:hypothetical protein
VVFTQVIAELLPSFGDACVHVWRSLFGFVLDQRIGPRRRIAGQPLGVLVELCCGWHSPGTRCAEAEIFLLVAGCRKGLNFLGEEENAQQIRSSITLEKSIDQLEKGADHG